ncbi:hypothetical protein EV2_025514 [Malus domestica]
MDGGFGLSMSKNLRKDLGFPHAPPWGCGPATLRTQLLPSSQEAPTSSYGFPMRISSIPVKTYYPMQWKSWKMMPDKVRTNVCAYLLTSYNFDDINDNMLEYINRLFPE